MSFFFAFLLTVALLCLTVAGARGTDPVRLKQLLLGNLFLAVLALLVGVILPFAARRSIFSAGEGAEWQEWAWDAFVLFLRVSLPVCGVLLLLTCGGTLLTALFDRKESPVPVFLRQAATVASSALFLFVSPLFASMADTPNAPLKMYILLLGGCEALLFRAAAAVELAFRLKQQKRETKEPKPGPKSAR